MPCLLSRRPAEGWRQGTRAALYGGAALLVAAVAVQPVAAEEVDELRSEMRQLLDRIDQLEQNQQQTQIEVDQIEANSAWLVNERPVRSRATIVTPSTTQGDYVSGGDFPGSFKLPGSDSSMSIYGLIQANYVHNFGPLRPAPTLIVPMLQPFRGAAGATNTGQTNFRFNTSQLNFETRTPTEYGQLRTIIQWDFFASQPDGGGNDSTVSEVGSAGIRLAQADIGPWTVGLHWTSFVDLGQYGETVDFEHNNAAPICRCTAITYADSLGGGWSFGVSIVDPVTQVDLTGGANGVSGTGVAAPGSGSAAVLVQTNTGLPDLQGNLKYAQDWGHVFVSGQVRRVSYLADDAAGAGGVNGAALRVATGKSEDSLTGWGFTVGMGLNDPFGLHPRDNFYTNVTYGEGMRGIIDISLFNNGLGHEATLDPFTGDLDANSNFALIMRYQHWWTDTIRSSFIWGLVRNSPGNDFDSIGTIRRTISGFNNLFWSPVPRLNLGIEWEFVSARAKGFGTLDGNNTHQVQAVAQVFW